MFDYNDDIITLTTNSYSYVYENNKVRVFNIEGYDVSYDVNNNKEYEILINSLFNEWVNLDEYITVDHMKFFHKIKEVLDFQLYKKCDFDWSKFIEEEEKERL